MRNFIKPEPTPGPVDRTNIPSQIPPDPSVEAAILTQWLRIQVTMPFAAAPICMLAQQF